MTMIFTWVRIHTAHPIPDAIRRCQAYRPNYRVSITNLPQFSINCHVAYAKIQPVSSSCSKLIKCAELELRKKVFQTRKEKSLSNVSLRKIFLTIAHDMMRPTFERSYRKSYSAIHSIFRGITWMCPDRANTVQRIDIIKTSQKQTKKMATEKRTINTKNANWLHITYYYFIMLVKCRGTRAVCVCMFRRCSLSNTIVC